MCGGMSQRYSELSALTHERLKILFAVFMVAVLIVVGHVVRAPPLQDSSARAHAAPCASCTQPARMAWPGTVDTPPAPRDRRLHCAGC